MKDITNLATVTRDAVTLTLTDNGELDQNKQPGVIEDPLIIATESSTEESSTGTQQTVTGSDNSVGCSISPAASPLSGVFNILIIASSLVAVRMRRS